jgi:hypothetical protein
VAGGAARSAQRAVCEQTVRSPPTGAEASVPEAEVRGRAVSSCQCSVSDCL